MPIYEYQCGDCGSRDRRVAGFDDHTTLCTHCSGLMLRLDVDLFQLYFEEMAKRADIRPRSKLSFNVGEKPALKKAHRGRSFITSYPK